MRVPTLLLLLGSLLVAWPAQAQSCSIRTEAVLFDPYDTLSGRPSDGVGKVHVTCDGELPFLIGLGTGNGGGSLRRMQSGSDELMYDLYIDAARQMPWGDGVGAAERSGVGPEALFTVYGRVPPNQNVQAGEYRDVVVVTITF